MSKHVESQKRFSPATLLIASASSLIAAVVVSHIWGRGTLIGAAITPVIITLVSEGLHRPARAIQTVRVDRGGAFDPIAEGRRGLREDDLPLVEMTAPRVVTARASRRPLRLALATGLVAFALAALALTASDLLVGHSAIASSAERTTLFGGSSGSGHSKPKGAASPTKKQTSASNSKSTSGQSKQAAPTQQPPATTTTTPAPPTTTTTPSPAPAQPQQQSAPPQAQQQSAPPASAGAAPAPGSTP